MGRKSVGVLSEDLAVCHMYSTECHCREVYPVEREFMIVERPDSASKPGLSEAERVVNDNRAGRMLKGIRRKEYN